MRSLTSAISMLHEHADRYPQSGMGKDIQVVLVEIARLQRQVDDLKGGLLEKPHEAADAEGRG